MLKIQTPVLVARLILIASAVILLAACASTIGTVSDDPRTTASISPQAIAFAPLSGPPPPVADRLATSFAGASLSRGLPLAPYRSRKSAFIVKGFISILPGDDGTTAVYVWDILDPDLKRLHRISGQTTDPAKAGDAWSALSQQTLDTIAETTLDQLALWMASR
jgi:hypothetical protein